MLLNFSNHASDTWSEKQLNEAMKLYDGVQDMAFPWIDPNWSSDEVEKLAIEYSSKIAAMKPAAVHIMGEMTFVYTMVRKLSDMDVLCIASTTDRVVTGESHGVKRTVFEFIRFREYRHISTMK